MTNDLAMYATLVQENMRLAAELEEANAEREAMRKEITELRLMQAVVDAKAEHMRRAAERNQIGRRAA